MILRHMIDIDETLKLTQSQGQGSRSIPAGKHFWKYKNVHLYQTGATDIFTRRKCPCLKTRAFTPSKYKSRPRLIQIPGLTLTLSFDPDLRLTSASH